MRLIFKSIMPLFLCVLSACSESAPTTESNPNEEIDTFLSTYVNSGNVPGIVAMVTDKNGIIYSGSFGAANLAEGRALTGDTLVRIASMTKPITSVAAMQLVEQGILALDVPVATYLPELSNLQILDGFDEDGNPILRPSLQAVTLRHLLTHTSGFVYTFSNEDALRLSQLENVGIDYGKGWGYINTPLAFEPGQKWEYGVGVDWVGVLIEEVSQKSLEEYFKDHIFDPLNMYDTRFYLSDEQIEQLATLYSRSEDGTIIPNGPWQNDPFYSGGSGLVSTTNDFMIFLQMMLNKGELNGVRILDADTIDLMSRNNIGDIDVVPVLHSYQLLRSRDVQFFKDAKAKFGLGFLINTDPIPEAREAGSLTWGGLYNTFFWIDPKTGIGGVFVTQLLPFFDPETIETFNQFEKLIYQSIKKKG